MTNIDHEEQQGMIRNSSWRRALVTAGATVTALALAAPSAGAAATTKYDLAGKAEALAFDLTLNDPLGLLNGVTGSEAGLKQVISQTTAELSTAAEESAVSTLLEGTLLNRSIRSGEQKEGREVIQELDAGIVKVTAGLMEFSVSDDLSHSKSQLAEVRVGLGSLLNGAVPVSQADVAALTDTVDTAVSAVEDIVGDLNAVLGRVEEVVNEVDDAAPVDLPELSAEQLPTLSAADLLSADSDLVHVKKLWADTVVEKTASAVTSTAKSGIVDASLLGGLVKVPAFTYTSTATANGQPGGAKADATVTSIAVELANQDLVAVEDGTLKVNGLALDLAELGVDVAQADALLSQVNLLLSDIVNAAGLQVAEGVEEEFAAPDGTRAEASTSAFVISLAPLNALTSVLGDQAAAASELQATLNLLPTKAVAAAQAAPVEVEAPAPAPNLPRTGGGALAVLFGGIAMVGALGLRKR